MAKDRYVVGYGLEWALWGRQLKRVSSESDDRIFSVTLRSAETIKKRREKRGDLPIHIYRLVEVKPKGKKQ